MSKTVELQGGKTYTYTGTQNLGSGDCVHTVIIPATATVEVASPTGRNIDAFRVPKGISGVTVENVTVVLKNTQVAAAVSDSGTGTILRNIHQTGSGRVLNFGGAVNLDADLIYCDTGSASEYCIYGRGDQGVNRNVSIRRFSLWAGKGTPGTPGRNNEGAQHAIRIYNFENMTLGDEKSLPNQTYAFYAKQSGVEGQEYGTSYGCALNIKHGKGIKLIRGLIHGKCGFKPLPQDEPAHPEYRLEGMVIDRCEFWTHGYLDYGSGNIGSVTKDSIIRAVVPPTNGVFGTQLKGACLSLGGTFGRWPAATGTFERVRFYGERLVERSNQPNLQNFTFLGCTFTGTDGVTRNLGLHGEFA